MPDAAFRRPVATSRGFATLRGLWTAGSGRVWVSARPPAVRHKPGWSSCRPKGCSRSRAQALLALTCPFRDQVPAAPHRGAASPIRRPGRRLVPQCCLSWGFVPYDTLSDRRIRKWQRIPPPPRATCEVWLPPSRHPPPALPAREAPERPWASPFKAFPSSREVPLSEPLPS